MKLYTFSTRSCLVRRARSSLNFASTDLIILSSSTSISRSRLWDTRLRVGAPSRTCSAGLRTLRTVVLPPEGWGERNHVIRHGGLQLKRCRPWIGDVDNHEAGASNRTVSVKCLVSGLSKLNTIGTKPRLGRLMQTKLEIDAYRQYGCRSPSPDLGPQRGRNLSPFDASTAWPKSEQSNL